MEIKISVIVPVYNTEKYLEKCIRSIIEQDFKDIEIICINDGSTDNSFQILQELANIDKRIVIVNKKNEGVAETRNLGMILAKGKYIQFIDSDDYLEKGYFTKAYEIIERNNLDILIFDYYTKENNEIKKEKDIELEENKYITGEAYLKILIDSSKTKTTFLWNKLIKREMIIKNNISIPKNLNIGEDVYLLYLFSYYSSKIGKYNKSFYYYVKNTSSLTNKEMELYLFCISILFQKIKDFFADKNVKSINKKKLDEQEFRHLLKILYLENHFENENYTKTVLRFLELVKNIEFNALKNENIMFKIIILILRKNPTLLYFKLINRVLIFCRKLKRRLKIKR